MGAGSTSGATTTNGGTEAHSGGGSASEGGVVTGSAGSGAGGANAGSPNAGGSAGAAAVDPSAELYDPKNLPRFDIELPQSSVDALNQVSGQDDPKQNTYVPATLRYGSETVTNVGIRIKGEGSFQRLDRKPAWKIKLDEFVSKQELRGLRRLTLNNLFEDPSFIAERLAYDVYRAAGSPAPRCNSALVYVNGTFYGVYANVEAEDKTFLRRWFSSDSGNLYEEGQSDFVPGAETAFNLETNETANDRTDLKRLIAAIQGATNPTSFLTDVGASLDMPQFLRFTALEAAVNQWDMYSYTRFWVNNFRMYDDPEKGKFQLIPWGHDLSMKPFRDSGRAYIDLFELAHQFDEPNSSISSGLLIQKCFNSPPCLAAYRDAVLEVAKVYDSLKLEDVAGQYYEQVKPWVQMDTRKNICCGPTKPLTNQEFETAYQSVLATVRGRTAALRADLAR